MWTHKTCDLQKKLNEKNEQHCKSRRRKLEMIIESFNVIIIFNVTARKIKLVYIWIFRVGFTLALMFWDFFRTLKNANEFSLFVTLNFSLGGILQRFKCKWVLGNPSNDWVISEFFIQAIKCIRKLIRKFIKKASINFLASKFYRKIQRSCKVVKKPLK